MNSLEAAAKIGLSIRTVLPADGPAMEALATLNEFNDWRRPDGTQIEIDWSKAYPYWLASEYRGEIVAALQVLPGRPMGRMECLMTHPSLDDMPKRVRAVSVRLLLLSAERMLHEGGSEMVSSLIPDWMFEYKQVVKHMGAIEVCHGSIMLAEVAA